MLKPIDIKTFEANAIKLIGEDWMLVCSGTQDNCNMMTASWGTLGVLWNKPVATIFVRPQRHTATYLENNDCFTLNFLHPQFKDILNFCGSRSGRDCNKARETGLVTIAGVSNTCYFEQSKLVLTCRKLYFNDIDPKNFIDKDINKNYPAKDYHRMYVAEIVEVRQYQD